jgi:hypothetical protein
MKAPENHPGTDKFLPSGWNLFWVIGWVLLTIYFLSPATGAMTWELDSSNYGSYSWMAKHHKQFGTEVIAMTGPYGFLAYGTTYSGDLFWERVVGDLLLKSVFTFLIINLVLLLPRARRWAWLALIILFLPNVGDLFYDFSIFVAGLWLLINQRRSRMDLTTVIAAGLLGFMGLMKGTNALVAIAAMAAIFVQGFVRGKSTRAIATGSIALIVFLTGWVAAKQSVGNLPAYFRGVWELANGYNSAMGLESGRLELWTGLLIAAGLALLFISKAWSTRRDVSSLVTVLFLGGFGFLKWKHGFVRADGHVFIFYNYAVLAMPALWLVKNDQAECTPKLLRILTPLVSAAVFISAASAASEFRWLRFIEMASAVPRTFLAHASFLSSPRQNERAREAELRQHRLTADLPQIRAEVGKDTIDFFGYEEGVLFLNGLNYSPRPMGGGTFNVYTRYLQEKNEAFLRNSSRQPEFQLVKLQTIDGRLPAADDPLTLNALVHFYTPVRAQRDYLLFKKRGIQTSPAPEAFQTVTVAAGQEVALPTVGSRELLLFSVEAPYSLSGLLRGFFFRPPELEIEAHAGTPPERHVFRLAPGLATVPVILSPLLENDRDLLGIFGADSSRKVQQISLRPKNEAGFAGKFKITFYKMPFPPALPADLAPELLTYLQEPLSNRQPVKVSTQETGIHELYGEPITLVHAPGEMIFPLHQGDQQVIFNYGLMPQAYDPGKTKGVNFSVEISAGDGVDQVIFSRLLQPVSVSGDRGMQWARVFLPVDVSAKQRLILRTSPGPTGDASWAQSYFTHVQIKAGAADAHQLWGFSAEPLSPGFEGHDVLIPRGRKARAFPPPSTFIFPISNAATRVTIGAGVQPSAYTGENHSDGMEVLVSIEAAGQLPRLLAKHFIDPANRPFDRDTQVFVVPLPIGLPGDAHLVVRAGAGPNGDDRWDWGYLETVYFSKF